MVCVSILSGFSARLIDPVFLGSVGVRTSGVAREGFGRQVRLALTLNVDAPRQLLTHSCFQSRPGR